MDGAIASNKNCNKRLLRPFIIIGSWWMKRRRLYCLVDDDAHDATGEDNVFDASPVALLYVDSLQDSIESMDSIVDDDSFSTAFSTVDEDSQRETFLMEHLRFLNLSTQPQ